MKKFIARSFSIVALAVFLVACGSKLNQDNFNKISNGMPYNEVVKILGEPQSSEGGGAFGITAGTSVWKDDKRQISIVFVNEKVASKTFNEVAPAATSTK